MECDKCGNGLDEGVSLYRINAKGEEEAIWRCWACMDLIQRSRHRADKELADIIQRGHSLAG